MARQHRKRGKRGQRYKSQQQPMLFSRQNYKLILIGVALIVLGFGGMYIENAVHGIYSLYFAPLLVVGGFGVIVTGILKTDPAQELGNQQES